MMAVVPVLMVLYSSDAVEIRYSDGSSLEFSPCGSTMIHVEPLNKRGHPRYGQSWKVQKRTRFVTSEHRQKVLQALDFRNRFAERSYLCEDLLPREDVVALYAKIDKIAWPQKLGAAKIDVLPDGSRSITSLDEFVTLIVSPHGHDFTVCFLSRTSQDNRKSKDPVLQKSDSLSHGLSSKSSQFSSGDTCTLDAKYCSKQNQVFVHPFEKSGHLGRRLGQLASGIDHSQITKDLQNLKMKNTLSASQLNSGHLEAGNLASQEVSTRTEKPEVHKSNTEDKELHTEKTKLKIDHLDNAANISFIQSNERCLDKLNSPPDVCCFKADSVPKEENHRPLMSFSDGCLNSHDISSISRSSTPDGLRTTVESDVTLLNDNILASFQGQLLERRQRRSSPTQYTSSPYDAQPEFPSAKSDRMKRNEDVSLSSSFLGNQKIQNQHKENSGETNIMQVTKCSDSGKDNSSSSTVNNSSGRVTVHGFELETSVNQTYEPVIHLPNKLDNSNRDIYSSQMGGGSDINRSADNTTRKLYKAVSECPPSHVEADSSVIAGHSDQTDAGSDLTNNADNTARKIYFKTSAEYIPSRVEADGRRGSEPVLEGHSFNKHQIQKEERVNGRQCREHYIWTTKHCSTNECPIMWTHPLKLVLEDENLSDNSAKERQPTPPTTLTLAARENSIFTHVPSPLPVTCPFQHGHRWMPNHNGDDDDDIEVSGTNPGEFQHGRLKIVISEGIVYRLVQRADANMIEIYPGDGSVVVSQGVKGHFFTHYMLVGDQLQERTYSLKSLPPRQSQGMYSIKHLIETANRLLLMNSSWEQRGLKEDVPCWKKEVIAVVEPLSSSLLEECIVEGLGKFSAFTNGRVRIVFEDRTSLDMVCNVSRRVQECFKHSQEPLVSLPCASSVSPPVPTYESIFGSSTGRLLLPSGEYVNVDIKKPGPYRKYIEVAQEWAAWVGSSPVQRQQFYTHYNTPAILQQAVEIELKKIFCFNYILEQTMLMQQLTSKNSNLVTDSTNPPAADIHPSNAPFLRTQPEGLHKDAIDSHHQPPSDSDPPVQGYGLSGYIRPSCPAQLTSSTDALISNQNLPASSDQSGTVPHRDGSTGLPSARMEFKSSRNIDNTFIGFESIRQVLLQNSSLINEIDLFLENSRKV